MLLFPTDTGPTDAELAYAVGPRHRRQRLATRAVQLISTHARTHLGVHNVILRIAAQNTPGHHSRRVLLRWQQRVPTPGPWPSRAHSQTTYGTRRWQWFEPLGLERAPVRAPSRSPCMRPRRIANVAWPCVPYPVGEPRSPTRVTSGGDQGQLGAAD
ncbi:GNAT family N-acetyltransferase [Actinacidiphila glaucinigra]|uniref:GNAT family N-acetyltransferase n=1 Tax=Actinacidiphila glaucinigra TaxID=235986 RepID=UPI00369B1768